MKNIIQNFGVMALVVLVVFLIGFFSGGKILPGNEGDNTEVLELQAKLAQRDIEYKMISDSTERLKTALDSTIKIGDSISKSAADSRRSYYSILSKYNKLKDSLDSSSVEQVLIALDNCDKTVDSANAYISDLEAIRENLETENAQINNMYSLCYDENVKLHEDRVELRGVLKDENKKRLTAEEGETSEKKGKRFWRAVAIGETVVVVAVITLSQLVSK